MKQAVLFVAIVVAGLTIHGQLAAQVSQSKKQPIRYTVIDLGLAADQTAGVADNDSLDYTAALPDGTVHATFRRHGKKFDLGTLGGPNSSALYGPSDRGQVVGKAETSAKDPNGEDFCFYGTNLICLAFVWQNGQMTALPILGGNNATASDINNRGEIVGYAETNTPDPTCPPPQVLQSPPVIWKNGEIRELPTFGGDPDGGGSAINDKGQIAGTTGNCATPFHAVRWDEDGHVRDLGNLGGTVNVAQGINNRGHVTGASNLTGDTTGHAFLWTEEKGMQDLGTVEGDSSSYAFSVNDKDQVVGISADINGYLHAFVWQDGIMTDLNKVIQHGFNLGLIEAFDINNRGEIIGLAALDLNDEDHAFLAIPCDEEHASWKGCENEDAAAIQDESSKSHQITLSEHARTSIWQHIGGRYRITPPPGMATQTAAEGSSEQDPSSSPRSSARPLETMAAVSAITDNVIGPLVHGYCQLNGQLLSGSCIGSNPFDQMVCSVGRDPQQCPAGAKAIRPERVTFGRLCEAIEVDVARRCSFRLP
jgi:probable HAF family extracellular repeat protein